MQILIGFLMCFALVISFTLGVVFGRQYNMTSREKDDTMKALEKEHLKKQKGFNNIMNYDMFQSLF